MRFLDRAVKCGEARAMTLYGVHTGLQNTSTGELIGLWQHIESLGFDWISVWDHFYAADMTGGADCLEAVACHAALAMATSKVRCGCLVYCAGYRHPAVLANAIATIDHLSGGRADVGIGAGWSQLEYDAYGIEFPSAGARLDIAEESATCVRSLLHSDEPTTFVGRHFTMTDARCEPRPVQPKLPVWIGGGGEKRTLKIAARLADGWNVPFLAPDEFGRKRGVLASHCEAIGRDPGEIRNAVNVGLAFTEADLVPQFGRISEMVRPGVLMGSDDQIRDHVGRYVDAGADQINIAARAPFDPDGLSRIASILDLAPA
jgi:alkanesulfonate monooxygenase SsuD/methylene tetrahydromethanopterin reductase-like flavin-dependent oxidoreductase (luciferase family)